MRHEIEMSDADIKKEMKKYFKRMVEICDLTRKNKVEYGFNICWDDKKQKTVVNKTCKGEKDCVAIPRCRWPDGFASIHVHPKSGGWLPSPADIKGSLNDGEAVFCIGSLGQGKKKDAFQCYAPTKEGTTIRRFIDAYWENDYETMVGLIGDSIMKPTKKTLFRPVFQAHRKNGIKIK